MTQALRGEAGFVQGALGDSQHRERGFGLPRFQPPTIQRQKQTNAKEGRALVAVYEGVVLGQTHTV
jgi:hypothetical protein